MIPRLLPVVPGRGGAWPFAGCFDGAVDDGDPEGPWVAWAGRVGPPVDEVGELERSWRSSREIHRALLRGGLPIGDAGRMLAAAWSRLDPGMVLPGIGPLATSEAADLSLLLVAGDRAGVAVTGSGLGGLVGIGLGEPILGERHPLFAQRGVPERIGAQRVAWGELGRIPRWLVGLPTAEGAGELAGLRARCGIPA